MTHLPRTDEKAPLVEEADISSLRASTANNSSGDESRVKLGGSRSLNLTNYPLLQAGKS